MPIVRPIAELSTKLDEISKICRDSGEPVFMTRQGAAELVVVSHQEWERRQARLELYQALDEAEADQAAGDEGVEAAAFFQEFGL